MHRSGPVQTMVHCGIALSLVDCDTMSYLALAMVGEGTVFLSTPLHYWQSLSVCSSYWIICCF